MNSQDQPLTDLIASNSMTIDLGDVTPLELIRRNKLTLNKSLTLHHWMGDNVLPEELYDLVHLEKLYISGFNLSEFPKSILKLVNLQEFSIRHTFIKKFPVELMEMESLLSLTFNSFELSSIPKSLAKWQSLKSLNLEHCIYLSKINELPPNLSHLSISYTGLNSIPSIVFSLSKLRSLEIDGLGLQALPIELFDFKQLEFLSLSENRLDSLPTELSRLSNLRSLTLFSNEFNEFPENILLLKKLGYLRLDSNEISVLPDTLANLKSLYHLDLANNNFTIIPDVILKLSRLKYLDFSNVDSPKSSPKKNEISYLHPSILQLKDLTEFVVDSDYITNVPSEIIDKGIKAIRSYFLQLENQEQDFLFEAKLLILGEPGAGKTTLTRKLEDEDCPLPGKEETTLGVDVRQHYFSISAATFPQAIPTGQQRDFRLNIWDFGGQEIYKATHRFFLSDRAVYLLVANGRNEDTDFTYWLHMVEIFGGKSPLLIIINEITNRSYSIDATGLRGHFAGLGEVLYVNLDDANKGRLLDIRSQVERLAVKLPHVGNAVPAKWTVVREAVEANPNNVMPLQEYLQLCKANGIAKSADALVLSQYFHDIGVFLHFQDDALLRKQLFLKPTWATNAVYKVLDHPLLVEQHGRFSKQDADTIWEDDEFAEVKDDLLKLMQRFFITYNISDTNDYIVPEKLPANTPDYIWETENNLVLIYRYEYFMPKGLLTQFMVKKHQYITNQALVWRRGALLYRHDTVAEVTEPYGSRTIRVRIQGANKRDFMTIITEELDAINKPYTNLVVEKLIPCNCKECVKTNQPSYYEYKDLRKRIANNKSTVECNNSYLAVNVKGLIDEIFNPMLATKHKAAHPNKVFISYAHKDKRYLERLLKHFDVLKHEGLEVDAWSDKRLVAGVRWREEIERAMQECQIAILLVSTDFLGSKFIREEELPTILEAAQKRGVTVLTVVVSPCRFKQTEFLSDYQAINSPDNPLSGLSPAARDEVFLEVIDRVTALLPTK